MKDKSREDIESESTESSESLASAEVKSQENHSDSFHRQEPNSEWFRSGNIKSQEMKNETIQIADIQNYKSPFVFNSKASINHGLLIRYSRYLRKQKDKNPFYFKWGLWMNIGTSKCMHDILETRGQLEAKMNEPKWKSPDDVTILRLGLVPGQKVNKVALKVPLAEMKVFYLSLCNISMDNILYHSKGIHVPIIGLSLRPKENYAVVKLWLGSSESAQPEPEQILQLLQNIAGLVPEEYMENIASGIYIRKDGESYRVFDFERMA